MAATITTNHLPNEVLSMILAHLRKSDLKATRLVCRPWSSLAIRWLFNRVYISPRKLDLRVFKSITSDQRLSRAVKELVYDASYFDPELFAELYLEKLGDQAWLLTEDLKSDRLHSPDVEVDEFLTFTKGSVKAPFKDYGDIRKYGIVRRGYRYYTQLAQEQLKLFGSGEFLTQLCIGLTALENLERVTIIDEWEHNEYEESSCADTAVGAQKLNSRRLRGSPVARSSNPLFLEPSKWASNEEGNDADTDGSEEYQTMVRALSMSGRRIRRLDVCPTTRGGVPDFVFDTQRQYLHSDIYSADDISIFQHLKVLNLRIVSMEDTALGRSITHLKRLLASILELTTLDLSFGKKGQFTSNNIWDFQDIFDESFEAKELQYLLLEGFSATQDGLRNFLNHHRSLKELVLGDILLDSGRWDHMLDDIRTALPLLKEFQLNKYLTQYVGDDFVELYWENENMDSDILNYILHGGKNPLREVCPEGVRYLNYG